jgi:hypothetical protein
LLDETQAALNLAERCGAVAETISGYNALGLGLGIAGLLGPAHFYIQRGLRLAHEKGGLPDAARANIVAGALGFGVGEWDLTDRCGERALSLLQQLGDRSRWPAPLTQLVFTSILRSDFPRVDSLMSDFAATIRPESSNQAKACISLRRSSLTSCAVRRIRLS